MNIPLVAGQIALLHVTLKTEEAFELYGGTEHGVFEVQQQSSNSWLVNVVSDNVASTTLSRYNVYVRQVSTGREWVIAGGKVIAAPRSAGVAGDKLAPIEYFVTVPVVDNAVDLTGSAIVTGVVGPRGFSAYEIACMEGFEGTEAEWLEYIRQQTATLAVEQVTPLMERAEVAATNAANSETQAGKYAAEAKREAETATVNATDAAQSANDAATSASQAQESASAASSDMVATNSFMHQTEAYAEAAEASAEVADQKAKAAESSASEAFGSATQAKASETAAATAATNAEASANRAANSASQAQGSASEAKASETAAATAAANAEASATAAASNAETSAKSATEAAKSAEQVVESASTINTHDVYWAAWFKRQTDLDNHFKNTKLDGFNYELPNLKIGRYAFFGTGLKKWSVALPLLEDGERMFANCPFTEWNLPLPKLQNANVMFGGYTAAKFSTWTVDLPSLIYAYVMFEAKPLTEFHGNLDKLKTAQGMFTRCSALTVFDSALPALSDAPEMFNACILNKESALNVFTTLPTYTSGTHRITVGIHIDHQGDADIAEAVAEAEGKGWTVTVQWNGTASAAGASTWGLRRQTIFARVIEREAVDGSICRVLDWGHYVTAPAGYEEFSSVEAAQQALGLTNENN